VGDVPKMWLDIKKLKSLGWSPKYTSEQAVRKTIEDIVK
jgi:UDP-glucose 4-epimerase